MRVYRLEFLQPDGRWTGPYCAEWMTERAFEIRAEMVAAHTEDDVQRPWPDRRIFLANPGPDRYVCGTLSEPALRDWFGRWFAPLMEEGGHLAIYTLPASAPAVMDGQQVIYMQRQAIFFGRFGYPSDHLELVQRIHPTTDLLR